MMIDLCIYHEKPITLLAKSKLAHRWSDLIARSKFDRFRRLANLVYEVFTLANVLCPEVSILDNCLHLVWTEDNRKAAIWIDPDSDEFILYTNTNHGTGQTVYVTQERLASVALTLHKFLYGRSREQIRSSTTSK